MGGPRYPSIWRATARDGAEWKNASSERDTWLGPAMSIDHVMSSSLVPRTLPAWCPVCGSVGDMTLSWKTSVIGSHGAVAPDWHGAVTCDECGLPSNVRAASQLLIDRGLLSATIAVEGLTSRAISRLAARFPAVSEGTPPGETTRDCVVAFDTIERVADVGAELGRLRRAVRDGGRLVLSTHFDCSLASSVDYVAASPGAPVRRIGWDLTDALRRSGFREVSAHLYWAPWQGHLGVTSFVFEAVT